MRYRIEVAEDFGKAIGEFRTARGLSQTELARRVDIHRSYLSELETGAGTEVLRRLVALADALHIEISFASTEPQRQVGERGALARRQRVDARHSDASDAEATDG